MAVDPVCGMNVNEQKAAGSYEHDGVTYYFCSPRCLERFKSDPASLPGARSVRAGDAARGCVAGGVHRASSTPARCTPRSSGAPPGPCPICGMALEPRVATLSDAPNPELVDMARRFRLGAVLGAPVFAVTMADMVAGGRITMARGSLINWISLVLATPVVFWAGWPFFERAWASVVNRSLNMFTLIALGVGAAYVYSAAATVAPSVFPDEFRMHGVVETYFDTAVVITVLVLLGQVLELRARGRDHDRAAAASELDAENGARGSPRAGSRRGDGRGQGRRRRSRPPRRAGAGGRRRPRGIERRR